MTEIVKIRTKKGRIVTLTISRKTSSHYFGTDKFGFSYIIAEKDIDSLEPLQETEVSKYGL